MRLLARHSLYLKMYRELISHHTANVRLLPAPEYGRLRTQHLLETLCLLLVDGGEAT